MPKQVIHIFNGFQNPHGGSEQETLNLAHLLGKNGAAQASLAINTDDEITKETLLTRGGAVVHERVGAA